MAIYTRADINIEAFSLFTLFIALCEILAEYVKPRKTRRWRRCSLSDAPSLLSLTTDEPWCHQILARTKETRRRFHQRRLLNLLSTITDSWYIRPITSGTPNILRVCHLYTDREEAQILVTNIFRLLSTRRVEKAKTLSRAVALSVTTISSYF